VSVFAWIIVGICLVIIGVLEFGMYLTDREIGKR